MLRIYIALVLFRSYHDLEEGDFQSLKSQCMVRPCSAKQEIQINFNLKT